MQVSQRTQLPNKLAQGPEFGQSWVRINHCKHNVLIEISGENGSVLPSLPRDMLLCRVCV